MNGASSPPPKPARHPAPAQKHRTHSPTYAPTTADAHKHKRENKER